MIKFSVPAEQALLEMWAERKQSHRGLLIAISGRTMTDFQYIVRFVPNNDETPYLPLMDIEDLPVLSDDESILNLQGSTLDFSRMSGFNIDNPNPLYRWDDPFAQVVQDILTKQINPQIAAHRGWIKLLDVKDNIVYIEMGGGCVGCGLVDVTLKQGVEVALKNALPQIKAIIDTTDHASGTNPYYSEDKGGPQHQPAKGAGPQHQPSK